VAKLPPDVCRDLLAFLEPFFIILNEAERFPLATQHPALSTQRRVAASPLSVFPRPSQRRGYFLHDFKILWIKFFWST